jgi:hypothetical protein
LPTCLRFQGDAGRIADETIWASKVRPDHIDRRRIEPAMKFLQALAQLTLGNIVSGNSDAA